jgi:hypothetical protein
MFEMSPANMIGDLLFGSIAFCRLHVWQAHEPLEDHVWRSRADDFPYFIATP